MRQADKQLFIYKYIRYELISATRWIISIERKFVYLGVSEAAGGKYALIINVILGAGT